MATHTAKLTHFTLPLIANPYSDASALGSKAQHLAELLYVDVLIQLPNGESVLVKPETSTDIPHFGSLSNIVQNIKDALKGELV